MDMKGDAYPRGQGEYRYWLSREWDTDKPHCGFIMLNPSTANENPETDDPTIRQCISHAKRWGFGGLWVVNLFALRSTRPNALRPALNWSYDFTVGQENDEVLGEIRAKIEGTGIVVAGWGSWVTQRKDAGRRADAVRRTFAGRLCALGVTGSGEPKHPIAWDIRWLKLEPRSYTYEGPGTQLGDPCPTPASREQ